MTDTEGTQQPLPGSRRPLRWLGIDLAAVVVFTVIGMINHGTDLVHFPLVLWPFIAGLAIAWMVPAVRSLPLLVWPTGVIVWLSTTAIGLLLRGVLSEGVAGGDISGAFPVVTAITLGVLLIGWRLVLMLMGRAKRSKA